VLTQAMKELLKRSPLLCTINVFIKCREMKRSYGRLCELYKTPSILEDGATVMAVGRKLLDEYQRENKFPALSDRPRVIFVGTDWEQDRSGTVQALQRLADVTLFEHSPGHYGQFWPKSLAEVEAARLRNGESLLNMVEKLLNTGPVHAVIGQMWGLSMDWRTLSKIKQNGIAVINIAMDDRQAFKGRRLADGTWSGTLGLAPYLTLACTDAPECVSWYEAEGCNAVYFPESSDPELFKPMPVSKIFDVCFVGANYGIRAKMVHALEQAGITVQAYGKGWKNGRIPTEKVPELFAASKIILGCGTIAYADDFFALKLRDFDAPMSGSLYLTHDNPDLRALFDVRREIVTFSDINDMVAKVRYYLIHDEERERIASAGRLRAAEDHTWVQRFRHVLDTVMTKGSE
jgi:spore maturation protein CgeB